MTGIELEGILNRLSDKDGNFSKEAITNVLQNAGAGNTDEATAEETNTADSQRESTEEIHDGDVEEVDGSPVESNDSSTDSEADFTDVLKEEGLKYANEGGGEA